MRHDTLLLANKKGLHDTNWKPSANQDHMVRSKQPFLDAPFFFCRLLPSMSVGPALEELPQESFLSQEETLSPMSELWLVNRPPLKMVNQ